MSDDKKTPDEKELTTTSFDRRAFLKVLGAAFSTALLPETLSACADNAVPSSVSEVAALTARQTISVVRPEDNLVLTIGLVNLKRSTTGTLVKLTASLPAFIIIDFPPQAIIEDAAGGTGVPSDFFASSWLGGSSRLVFALPDAYTPVPFSLSAILGVCGSSSIVVSDPMKTALASPAGTTVDPDANAFFDGNLSNIGAAVDPAAAARKMTFDGTLPAQSLLGAYPAQTAAPPGISDGSVSLVELPYRLQLSPNAMAGWSHATTPVQGQGGAFEVWHTTLGVRSAAANVAGTVDERNAFLRTARALASRDTTSGVAWDPQRPGTPVVLQNPTLDGPTRQRIVKLSSQDAGAKAIQINRMMLSSLGGYLDARGDFVDPQHIVDGWVHRMTGGRENYVEVAASGFLLPFGNAVRKFHITKRNEDPAKGPIGSLYQFDLFVISNPITSYRPADYQVSTRGKLLQWPFAMVELTQTQFIAQASTSNAYWPNDMSGSPIMVPAVGYDQRGHAIHFFVPFYFVGPAALPVTATTVSTYRSSLGTSGITAPPPNNTNISLDLPMGGQRIAYAQSMQDDTTFATRELYVDLAPVTGEAFPFVPILTGAQIDVEALQSYTSGAPVTVTYHARYASNGLDTTQNKSQLLFSLTNPVTADFTNRPDGGTGFVAPNMRFSALSRTTGPAYDFTSPPAVPGAIKALATTPAQGDGGFDPQSYLSLAASELDKIKIFGVFRLIDIVKAIDPNEAANDMAGLAQEAEQAALKYAPKFVAEGLSEIEKLISSVMRIKSQIETIWTNVQELLGPDYVAAILANPGGTISATVSGSLATATQIADNKLQTVITKLTDIVTKLKAFYTTLCAALTHIKKLEVKALAGIGDPADGSISQLIDKGTAVKDAIVDLANYGARAAINAKNAIVAASNQIPAALHTGLSTRRILSATSTPSSDPTIQVTNSPLQIIPGLFNEFVQTFEAVIDISGVKSNPSGVKDKIMHLFNDAKAAVSALRDMTVHIDWTPKIGSFYVPGTDWLVFRPASQHSLSLALEARTKSKAGKPAGVDVDCRLDHFDLCLGSLDPDNNPTVALQFDHISFTAKAGTKPDVDVKINGIKFGGQLSFLETLRKVIPLDGFSDPPFLHVDSKGIHAGFTLQIPNVAVGIFSIENISLSAKLEVPFFSDGAASALTFTFSFCDKDHPFLITVSMLGGGGYFVMSLNPHGIESLEASICVGAQIAISLASVAQGSVSIMVGITFTIKNVTDASGNPLGKDISLSAFLRLHGELDVLGIITVSIDLNVTMTYEFSTKVLVAEGTIRVDVSLLFFSVHKSFEFRREFHACNNDPTLRELMPPNASNVSQFWNDYCHAYA